MRVPFVIGAAVAALAVSGCASLGSPSTLATYAKSLSVAEAAVTGAADLADQAAKSGVLKGASATRVKVLLDDASLALDAAETAYHVGDAAKLSASLATVTSDVAAIQAEAGKKGA